MRSQMLSALPPLLLEKWRKFGQWDYKQVGFEYRDYTQFNFGATGSAAKIDEKSLMLLARAFRPTPEDVKSLADSDLEPNFARNTGAFENLLKMAEQDGNLTRIATDYTWLTNDTKWPRDDVGLTSSRWDEYRVRFKALSLVDGIVRSRDFPGAIFFVSHSNGLCTGGSSVGYVYSTTVLTPAASSPAEALDSEARKEPGRHYAYVFKSLNHNWYTFYEIDW